MALEVKCDNGHHWLVALSAYWSCFSFLRCPECDKIAGNFRLAQEEPIVNPARILDRTGANDAKSE